jgi:membrane AbrB-like protein
VKPARDSWANPLLALCLCAAAGGLFAWLRLPLPWMIGPLAAMAACNLAGTGFRPPAGGRALGQLVIGTALGLYFTPLVVHEVASYWYVLVAASVFAILLGAFGGWVLRRVARVDGITAFFASVPGGAAEMMILGERFGARPDRVALSQSLRVVTVVLVVPFALTYSGVHGSDLYQLAPVPLDWPKLLLLLAIAAGAAFALNATGMPNAFVFGPLAAVTVLTASEFQFSSVPTWLSNGAQLLLGCALGTRFERRSLGSTPRYVMGVLASVAAAMGASVAFAALLAWATGLPLASVVLATAPGGMAEMCITAKVLQLGVPLVTAAHLMRVVVLITTTGPTFRAARALRKRFQRR